MHANGSTDVTVCIRVNKNHSLSISYHVILQSEREDLSVRLLIKNIRWWVWFIIGRVRVMVTLVLTLKVLFLWPTTDRSAERKEKISEGFKVHFKAYFSAVRSGHAKPSLTWDSALHPEVWDGETLHCSDFPHHNGKITSRNDCWIDIIARNIQLNLYWNL